MSGESEIKLTINNWLGEVLFETTKDEIDEFLEYYEWEYDENNHTIESYGSFFSEPYESLDPSGEFVVVSDFSIYDGENSCSGYEFEFINCEFPIELKEYITEDGWIFIDDYQELIKDNVSKSKFSEIVEEGHYEINNRGTGCLRLSDFNYEDFLDLIGAKEPGSDQLYDDVSNDNGENIINIGGGIYEKFQKKNGKINGTKETYVKERLIKSEEFKDNVLDGITKIFGQRGELKIKHLIKNNITTSTYKYWLEMSDSSGNPYLKELLFYEGNKKVTIGFGINGRGNDFNHPNLHNVFMYNFSSGKDSKDNESILFKTEGDILRIWDGKNHISGDIQELNDKEEINFINDIKVFKCFYPNGNLMEKREMKNGKVHGSWKRYYEDGVLGYETNHIESKLNGKSISYFNDGEIMGESYYKNGKCESEISYHKNGNIKSEKNFLNGKEHGHIKVYYETGILWYNAEYKNGLQDGKIVSYDEKGNKAKESHLVKGEYEGSQTEWWPSGEIKAKREYKDGKVISEETF